MSTLLKSYYQYYAMTQQQQPMAKPYISTSSRSHLPASGSRSQTSRSSSLLPQQLQSRRISDNNRKHGNVMPSTELQMLLSPNQLNNLLSWQQKIQGPPDIHMLQTMQQTQMRKSKSSK